LPGRNLDTNPSSSLNWPLLLDALPLLAPAHLESLLKRRNIKMAVRSLARFLSLSLPANILEMILIPRKWYVGLIVNLQTPHQISSSEISSSLQKLAFLTLITSSNSTHPPKGKTFSSEIIGGILFAKTRYSSEGLEKVFKTHVLPIISSSHRHLFYRIFQNSHIVRNPMHKFGLGPANLSVSLTAQWMKPGFTAVLFGHARTIVSRWVNLCQVVFVVLDGSKTVDVVKGIQQLALRYRMPEILVLDSRPQL
jgi:hypothetical protein